MKNKISGFLLALVSVLFWISVTNIQADPITFDKVRAFLDNEGENTIGTGFGRNFSVAVYGVAPDSDNGTTATAGNELTGDVFNPLPDLDFLGWPDAFGTDMTYQPNQPNQLSPWKITLKNGNDELVVETPDRTGTQEMEFVKNLAITGAATAPTITWQLPTTGAKIDRVTYQLWDDVTNKIIGETTEVPGGATAVSLKLSGLEEGAQYAIRITPVNAVESGPKTGTVASRSSNWINWEARDGVAEGNVLELVTGSPSGVSQTVDTPDVAFNFTFDYQFTTTTGYLEVFLNNMIIGTRLNAAAEIEDGFLRAIFEVEDPFLLGLANTTLLFQLDGLTGSRILIDNISFPGLINGDFESALASWEPVVGEGYVGTTPVPEPATMLLFGTGLVGLAGSRLRKKKK